MFYSFFVKTYGVSNFWSIVQYVGKEIEAITLNWNFLIKMPHPKFEVSLELLRCEWLPVKTNEEFEKWDISNIFSITDSAKTSPISGTPPMTKIDFFAGIVSKSKIVASEHMGLKSISVFVSLLALILLHDYILFLWT